MSPNASRCSEASARDDKRVISPGVQDCRIRAAAILLFCDVFARLLAPDIVRKFGQCRRSTRQRVNQPARLTSNLYTWFYLNLKLADATSQSNQPNGVKVRHRGIPVLSSNTSVECSECLAPFVCVMEPSTVL